jgi:pyruvate decarboxylase
MIHEKIRGTIFLLNNFGYTIEKRIHDGPYNNINNWNYSQLIEVFNGRDDLARGVCVKTCAELNAACQVSTDFPGLMLIECQISSDDCTSELLYWGSRVSAATMRK